MFRPDVVQNFFLSVDESLSNNGMNHIIGNLAILFSALCVAGIAYYCLNFAREITYVTLADGRRQARSLPLIFKILLPFAGNLRSFVMSVGFRKARDEADRRIVTAGFEGLITGWEFLAIRIMNPVVMGIFWAVVLGLLGISNPIIKERFMLLEITGIALFAIQPSAWLSKTIKQRQKSIQRAMPFLIDLLTLSVEAGVDFMNALQRSIDGRKMDALTEELIRVNHEIQLGTSRRNALKNLASRCDMPDMRSFAFALIQADELGVSIGSILRIQSDQMRQKRFARAEKLANEAPVKMLFPLMVFIFPAVFIVLLGPILSQIAGAAL